MPRVISFIVLLAIALLIGAIFFQVMAQFFVPLFLACVLLVVFEPLHRGIVDRMPHWPRTAALLTTVSIILVVVLPLVWLGWKAYVDTYAMLNKPSLTAAADEAQKTGPNLPPPPDQGSTTIPNANPVVTGQKEQVELTRRLTAFVAKDLAIKFAHKTQLSDHVDDDTIYSAVEWASGYATRLAITGVQSVIGVLFGLFILVIALYYFLADGPAMIEAVMTVSPLDRRYEQELLLRFSEVSRAVVVATLLAALAQGALAGIGYYFALPSDAPIFLLTALTVVGAFIPILGAFAIWILVCVWVYLQGQPVAAIVLAAYCTVVVSVVDNILKPLILHGQSKLHPLLALLSILGGVQVFGPVGILVGPMLVSFLQAILNMLRKELDSFGGPVDSSSKPLAESVVDALNRASDDHAASSTKSLGHLAGAESSHGKTPQSAAKAASSRRAKRKR